MNSSFAQRLLALIRLGRPHFLVGGFVLYGLGAALAALSGAPSGALVIDGRRYAWGQAAITAIQLMTHYCNDYFDFAADQANTTSTRFSGGSRVLPGGVLRPGVALVTALALAGVALLAIAVVARLPGAASATAPLLLMMLALAWEYSAPPLRLHSRGLGELTTAAVVTLLTPLAGFYLQAGRFAALPFLAVLPLCAFQFTMLLAIEFPDAAGDASVGKRTLVVRLGAARAARLYNAVLAAAYLSLPALAWVGMPVPIALAVAATAPVAAWQARRMAGGAWAQPARWESLALVAVALVLVSSSLMLVAALWMLARGAPDRGEPGLVGDIPLIEAIGSLGLQGPAYATSPSIAIGSTARGDRRTEGTNPQQTTLKIPGGVLPDRSWIRWAPSGIICRDVGVG